MKRLDKIVRGVFILNGQSNTLTELLETSNGGHVLYVYDELECYVNKAVAFIVSGIHQGHHIIIIDSQSRYQQIQKKLKDHSDDELLDWIHYVDNYEFYRPYDDFHGHPMIEHFSAILEPLRKQEIPLRTWAHVEWKAQPDIFNKINAFECEADHSVNAMKLFSVCAYDGQHIPASLQNMLLRSHDYHMTDFEFGASSLYKNQVERTIMPSLKNQVIASKSQLSSFIMQNLDPILMFNKEERLIAVNHAFEKTFGWKSDELAGLSMMDFPTIPSELKHEVKWNIQQLEDVKDIEAYETQRVRKDGTRLDIMLSSFPFRNEDGLLDGWAVVIKDITELKKSEKSLLQSEKLTTAGQLAASIAHEIRNPVTTVKGFLQLLHSDSDVNENLHYYDIMTSEIERIELILGKLLVLAKPQAIKIAAQDIQYIVSSIISFYEPQASMYNVQIVTNIDSVPLFVKCEENQIKQVCNNVIKNAIESMKTNGGKLSIQLSAAEGNRILMRFQDQGKGIPPHVLQQLGQPFYTTKEKGTGLGVMISKKIIADHHGTMNIKSTVNKGTQVDILLPRDLSSFEV